MRSTVLALLVAAIPTLAFAQGQPPIRSPQDAACRSEAQARVFGTPNPRGLSMHDLGAQIYHACMRRSKASGTSSRSRHRHRR